MSTFSPMGTPPSITPSDICRFFRAGGYKAEPFTSAEFAAYFGLTPPEAQEALHRYVDEELLTFVGFREGIETWHYSCEGFQVFGVDGPAKRLTKKDLQAVKSALLYLAPALAAHGVVELSWGGRPAFGKPNGTLLVGVRLDHEPYTQSEDAAVLERVLTAVNAAAQGECYAILLFRDAVPDRLRQRVVLTGESAGQTVNTPDAEVDRDEVQQASYLDSHLRLRGCRGGINRSGQYNYFSFDDNVPWYVRSYLKKETALLTAPRYCARSPLPLNDFVSGLLEKLKADSNFRRELDDAKYGHGDRSPVVVAEAEYFACLRKLDAYCQNFDPEKYTWQESSSILAPDALKLRLLAEVHLRREGIATARAEKEKKAATKRQPNIRYSSIFDCINFKAPRLVGFVRQPASNSAGTDWVKQFWSPVIRGLRGTPGQAFKAAGFSGAALSLFERPATAAEIEAYDAISKQQGCALKCIVMGADQRHGLAVSTRIREAGEVVDVPDILAKADLPKPVLPKLLLGSHWTLRDRGIDGASLFGLIDSLPAEIRARVNERIINTESISMAEFAARASRKPCTDPMILASQVTDAWDFATRPGYWFGLARGEDWSVALEDDGKVLTLKARIADFNRTWQLAPYVDRRPGGNRPYNRQLSSLLNFMQKMRDVKMAGVSTLRAAYVEEDGRNGEQHLTLQDWFVYLLDNALRHGRGYYDEWDFTGWPHLMEEPEEVSAT